MRHPPAAAFLGQGLPPPHVAEHCCRCCCAAGRRGLREAKGSHTAVCLNFFPTLHHNCCKYARSLHCLGALMNLLGPHSTLGGSFSVHELFSARHSSSVFGLFCTAHARTGFPTPPHLTRNSILYWCGTPFFFTVSCARVYE